MTEKDTGGIFDEIKKQKLTDNERLLMHNDLSYFVSTHPIRIPVYIQVVDAVAEGFIATSRRIGRNAVTKPVTTALVLALFAGVGTSYAAEGSLPGDTLYPIKIHVNEQVQGALAFSPEAKADWSATLAERRLEEAELVAAKGSVTPEAKAQIQSGIDSSTSDFNARVAELQKTPGKALSALNAQAHMEAALVAHEDVLSSIGQQIPQVDQAIKPIVNDVRSRATALRNARTQIESQFASATDTVKVIVNAKKDQAQASLKEFRALEKVQKHSSLQNQAATSTENATTSVISNEEVGMSVGDQQLSSGDYGSALKSFDDVIRAADTATIRADIKQRIRQEVNIEVDGQD